ncbi:MAG: amino acid adenylation domain-containing protein [Pirellulaceae bacterium]|nr:amino acid adenylation domain-containing protein [Pirellulaceae bacterium]
MPTTKFAWMHDTLKGLDPVDQTRQPLASQAPSELPTNQRELLAKLLRERAASESRFAMSAGQQGLWHAYRRNPNLTAFNVFLPTRIRAALQPEVLRRAINQVAERHAALRTTFSDHAGQLAQIVHRHLEPEFICRPLPGATDEAIRQRLTQEMLRPFDLQRGPLLRISVYQLADDDWVILALTHHIIVDFWSLILILSELRQLYPQLASGQELQLPAAVDNYQQFVVEQQAMLDGNEGLQLAQFWRETLQNTPPVLEIPSDRPRPATFTHRADCTAIRFSRDVSQRVVQLASRLRATSFAVVHAALQVLLSRYSRQESFFIGSPFSGRLHHKYEQTVGFFINMLPLKAEVRGQLTFAQLVQQTSRHLVDTLEHEAFPIAEIVRQAGIARDPSRSPLFQVSCTFEKSHRPEEAGRGGFLFPDQTTVFDFGGLRQESFYVPHPTCHYDLEFVFEQAGDRLQGMLIFCQDLFNASSMQVMSENFSSLLDSLLAHPEMPLADVPWDMFQHFTGKQRQTSAATDASLALTTVHEMILQAAARNPGGLALQADGQQATYRDLFMVAHGLSHRLKAWVTHTDQLVAVVCRQGSHAFVGMLAVQLAGGAAVPIDATQPSISLKQLLGDENVRCVLTDCRELLPDSPSIQRTLDISLQPMAVATPRAAAVGVAAGDLAYMIYTSGSTGVPKGVMVQHGSICNTLAWRTRALPLTTQDRVLMLLSHQFDAALGIAWSCLAQGATLIWADQAAQRDPILLLQQIQRDAISVLPSVPSLLKILVQHPQFARCGSLKQVWTGGEPLPPELPTLIRSKLPVQIWNLYGPTEAAVEATAEDVTHYCANQNMTIGRPIDAMQVLVLGEQLELLPDTVPGQLAICGPGLARGYFGDPTLTGQRFVTSPHLPGKRLYLTGDLGRRLPDGRIEFLGRLDHQVKVRGYRIELGEIESVIESHPQVERAAVIVDQPDSPSAQLVAYVGPVDKCSLDPESLRSYLAARLPHFKVPAAIVSLTSMPLTGSGKVDRRRLPQHVPPQSWLERSVPPRNPLEQYLADQWSTLLNLPTMGIHQNFFAVGGSSLQAAILTGQLSDQLGVHVPTALLFDLADIAQVARRLVELHPQVMMTRFGLECVEFYQQTENTTVSSSAHPLLAPLKPSGNRPPIFMVHPPGGIVVCYRELAQHLPESQPLWAIRSRGLHGHEQLPESIQQMASEYLAALGWVQPAGPYTLGGWSLGGLIAYEMARQLIEQGKLVERLVFLDTTIPEGATDCVPLDEQVNVGQEYGIQLTLDQLGELSPEQQLPLLHAHADKLGILDQQSPKDVVARVLSDLQNLFHHHVKLSRQYKLQPIPVRLLLLRPQEVPFELAVSPDRGWRHLVDDVQVHMVPGHHHSMVQSPHVSKLAAILAQQLQLMAP